MKTLADLGAILGVTRERVRQIEAKSLKKLRPNGYGSEEWMGMDLNEKLELLIAQHEKRAKLKTKRLTPPPRPARTNTSGTRGD